MRLSIVVAAAVNNVIGRDNRLPWRLKTDQRRFRELTKNHTVVMGRKTWESLPKSYRPLPGRRNIVLTHQRHYQTPGAEKIIRWGDLPAITAAEEKVFVIGGEAVYRLALAVAEDIFLTRVLVEVAGDAFMPSLEPEWLPIEVRYQPAGPEDDHPVIFYRYCRRPAGVKIPIT